MASAGLKRYSLSSQGPNQTVIRELDILETSNGVFGQKPLFEAFRNGAWWYAKPVKKIGKGYLVFFEGYGKYEEQELTSQYIRPRSRKARSLDCRNLTLGTDVVVFAVHPHAFRAGSNKSCYSAWYDVKIIAKEYKHPLYTCACKYKVQFHSDWSRNTQLKRTRALLEGETMDVSISKISIMQAALDSPLEKLIEKGLAVSEDSIKRQWTKDTHTLDLSSSNEQPLYSTTVTEDARKELAAAKCGISRIDLTPDLTTDVNLEDVTGPNILPGSHTMEHLKDGKTRLHNLRNQREPFSTAKLVDLSDNLSIHGNNWFLLDACTPEKVASENGRKRTRIDLPRKAKVNNPGVYAERGRKKKQARQTVFSNESLFCISDGSSSSYKLSSSGSDCQGSHSSECTLHEEAETMDHSDSRSTPIFYGNGDKDDTNVESMQYHEVENQGGSTSTQTFYGNTAANSKHSSSTGIFFGSCANEVDNSSTSNIAQDALDHKKVLKTDLEGRDYKSLPAEIPHAQHDNIEEVDSISTSCERKDPFESNERSECYCDTIQISSEGSQCGCRACLFLQADDSTALPTPASSQGESFKRAQEPAQKSKIKRPCKKKSQDTHEFRSESESVHRRKVVKKGRKSTVDYKQKRKLDATAPKNAKKNADDASLRPRSRNWPSKDRARFSKTEEGKRNFNNLFDAILKNVHELTRVKMVVPSEQSFVSSIEERQNQDSWDPIIFHENQSTGVCENDLTSDDPLKELWKDMESTLEEMHGVAALKEEHIQPSLEKASACEHNLVLKEEEGYVCSHCGLLVTSIEEIFPPVLHEQVNHRERDTNTEAEKGAPSAAFTNSTEHQHMQRRPYTTDMESVWKLVQELRPLMQKNQVDGFNFLWGNIGALSSRTDNEGGGCIIAHAPGTGKSLLIISFLKSFLHLHSWCRPLIVAPKNMLFSWKKEFEKWNSGIKVHLLQSSSPSPFLYLNIISEWQKSTSVLIVSYQLFSQRVFEQRACPKLQNQQIGSLLLHIPDILILDEGHVPRNCSQLRDGLLQSRTRFKILVTGTLFQNNVQELFNLLYLARPNFLSNLQTRHFKRLDGLDLENDNQKQWQTFEEFDKQRRTGTSNEQVEVILRKIFMEEIGNRLEDNVQEAGANADFRLAIDQLRALTAPFIHFYNGGILNTLPGIREFIVVLQATSLQMSLSTQISHETFLETALSIHPSLLLKQKGRKLLSLDVGLLQALRGDPLQGPKVKFILDLADCCGVLKEKLLIFSQFVQTLQLIEKMLQKKEFKVVMITGKNRLEERQRTMEEFNEGEGMVILLASVTACGEGINLTGASRVVFLDMHWNPARMKQAVARAFRIGQKRVVYTYWLVASVEKEAEKFTRIHKKDWLSRSIFSSGTEVVECHRKESKSNVEVEDYVLAHLLRNDITKSILKVFNYSATERQKASAFFEGNSFPGI